MQNLYDLLGVRPDDDAENLRRAYRKAVKESHPDHHGSDPEAASRFRQITEAYGVLRNADRRAAYDLQLEFERRPLRWKVRRALSGIKRHAMYDVLAGAVFAAMLAAAYELHIRASVTFFDEASVIIAPGQDSGDQPVGQSDAAGHGRSEQRVAAPQMPIVVPIAPPAIAPAENDGGGPEMTPREPADPSGEIKIAARDNESDGGVELVDRHEMPSSDVQFPAPNPSSASVPASVDRRDVKAPDPSSASAGGLKLPEIKTMTARPQQIAAKRHVASRSPALVEQAALENRDTAARDTVASDNSPSLYVFGVGY